MEDTHGAPTSCSAIVQIKVLILIIMEDTHGVGFADGTKALLSES